MSWLDRIRRRRNVERQISRVIPATRGRWTRDEVIEAIQLWAFRYGEPPRWVDWSPSHAAARCDLRALERMEPLGSWPTSRQVTGHFDTWNLALRAAGFRARPAHRPRKIAVIKPRPA